jgi:hypothetical protein
VSFRLLLDRIGDEMEPARQPEEKQIGSELR